MMHETLYETILEHLPLGLIIMNTEREVVYINPLARRQMGLKLGDRVPYCSYCRERPVLPGEERCILMHDDALPIFAAHMPVYEGESGYFQMMTEKIHAAGMTLYILLLSDQALILEEEKIKLRELLLKESMRAEVKAHEAMSKELHDDIGQILFGALLMAQNLARRPKEKVTAEKLRELSKLIDDALNRIKRLAKELRPTFLEHLSLSQALQQAVHDWQALYDVSIKLHIDRPHCDVISKEAAFELYRVLQEAVRNAVSHGGASSILIDLACRDRHLLFSVIDNGCGLDTQTMHPGLGLFHMKERIERLGGEIHWFSKQGGPTKVEGTIPFMPDGGA
ncbi:MAG: Sensory box histidine kinase [Candidatus Carbobacillus altaicus]|uniref:histidine kinase n=1 Tax=Candidatus Carbonibacillus altaicus TaxID=2163959 RepID=A0A2R6Y3F6_9BACL|nr:MAG: Sensory box histidine kinase [Candidatus Carbobacillus altaicus]